MPKVPKPDKPAYTPITPTMDTLIGPRNRIPLFGASSAGSLSRAPGQKKTLIGGSA